MSTIVPAVAPASLAERFGSVRKRTLETCKPLTPEDMMVQSCPEASPAKWHLAHTTWFFESFVLNEFVAGYRPFHPDFVWLFNSYYQTFANFPEKRLRASFSRPAIEEVLAYRARVDEAIGKLLEGVPNEEALARIELGVNHEEQHQELLLTDTLHAFFTNPLRPVYKPLQESLAATPRSAEPMRLLRFEGGLHQAGHAGEGFCYDNELPRHNVWLEAYGLGERLVTCGEYAEFIEDGGYRQPELWLSDGWNAVQSHGWNAPLYWSSASGEWTIFTLRGEVPMRQLAAAPVSQVSFYEADAYARWAGFRLPTEFEWESAAEGRLIAGNLLDSGHLMPLADHELEQRSPVQASTEPVMISEEATHPFRRPGQLFGDCWEWTASAYLGYPGFRPLAGSLGEYNGKFMSGQMVLRGGSCVTPRGHIRASYRNFFSPETRWQFSGIRLASG